MIVLELFYLKIEVSLSEPCNIISEKETMEKKIKKNTYIKYLVFMDWSDLPIELAGTTEWPRATVI